MKKGVQRHAFFALFLAEGLAIGALVSGGVCLMGTHLDPLQGAVVRIAAVISALLNSTGDALVCVTVHGFFLLFFRLGTVCPKP